MYKSLKTHHVSFYSLNGFQFKNKRIVREIQVENLVKSRNCIISVNKILTFLFFQDNLHYSQMVFIH
jgi:hypothetical protein